MRTSTLTVALVSVLLVAGAGTVGALTVGPLHPQESPTGTTDAGTTGTSTAGGGSGGQSGPSITFDDQESSGQSVLVQSAALPQKGFIVIYDSSRSGNETNQIIGASYPLSPGTSDNIRIPLDEPLGESKSLTAVIHTDSNSNGEFDYVSSGGQQDPPLMQGDRRIVDIAQVSVQGGASGTGAAGTGAAATGNGGDTTAAPTGTQAPSGGNGGASGDTGTAAASGGDESGGNGGSGAFGPGFGPVVALVALLAAALIAARRR